MKSIFLIFCLLSGRAFGAEPLVPKADLSFWNNEDVRYGNNCYNYATNRETDDFAQPGDASGQIYRELTCPEVIRAASADLGLTPTRFFPFSSIRDESLIAVVVWPDSDYHWYRRGADGMWTHKNGQTPATNLDQSGHLIESPETADRGDYTEFCGYFKIQNFKYDASEQNGGYVRIGGMRALPDLPGGRRAEPFSGANRPSEIIVNMYSGRPNPTRELREFLQNARAINDIKTECSARIPLRNRLGYRGISIHDHQGLISPKGSILHCQAGQVESAMRAFVLK